MRIISAMTLGLIIAAGSSLAQTSVEVQPEKQATTEEVQQIQKVSEMRQAVIMSKQSQPAESNVDRKKQARYDTKGGLIVPDASKGIRLSGSETVKAVEQNPREATGRTAVKAPAVQSELPKKDLNAKRNK